MRKYLILTLLMQAQAFAKAPECPLYHNKQECLLSVQQNYDTFLDFINENSEEDEKDSLIQASLDIKKHESLACQKTCLD